MSVQGGGSGSGGPAQGVDARVSMKEGGLARGISLSRSEGDPCREVVVAAWRGGSEPKQVEESSRRGLAWGGGACLGLQYGQREMSPAHRVRTLVLRSPV